jgi:hypothetical protein
MIRSKTTFELPQWRRQWSLWRASRRNEPFDSPRHFDQSQRGIAISVGDRLMLKAARQMLEDWAVGSQNRKIKEWLHLKAQLSDDRIGGSCRFGDPSTA